MRIRILCVGRLKERAMQDWLAEFQKRLTRYAPIEWMDFKKSDPKTEAECILRSIKDTELCILIDRKGKTYTSEEFASLLKKLVMQKDLVFVLGGSEGVTADVRKRAAVTVSFGPMTVSHQLARVMLTEQLYRAFTIIQGEPYHM